jgi:hypothetical protein
MFFTNLLVSAQFFDKAYPTSTKATIFPTNNLLALKPMGAIVVMIINKSAILIRIYTNFVLLE